jgi:hypothetical protein
LAQTLILILELSDLGLELLALRREFPKWLRLTQASLKTISKYPTTCDQPSGVKSEETQKQRQHYDCNGDEHEHRKNHPGKERPGELLPSGRFHRFVAHAVTSAIGSRVCEDAIASALLLLPRRVQLVRR